MTPKIKNIIIFLAIGAAFVLIYIFFIKPSPETPALVSSTGSPEVTGTGVRGNASPVAEDFLALLLSVQGIGLDDSIFSDNAFMSLHDSSIQLIPDISEGGGRINPFAPLGSDAGVPLATTPGTAPATTPGTAPLPPLPSSIAPGTTAPGAPLPKTPAPKTPPAPPVTP